MEVLRVKDSQRNGVCPRHPSPRNSHQAGKNKKAEMDMQGEEAKEEGVEKERFGSSTRDGQASHLTSGEHRR
jgi:hypothetical protein